MRLTEEVRSALPRARGTAVLWWRVLRATYLRYCLGGAPMMAAAIAFYSVVCLGPLGILLAAVVRFLYGPGTDTYTHIQKLVGELGAGTAAQVMPQVNNLLAQPESYVASIVGLVMLLWASMRLFEMVERSLTEIWPGRALRGYFTRKLVSLAMLGVAGLLLAGVLLANAFAAVVRGWLGSLPDVDAAALDRLRPQLAVGLQLGVSFLAFTLLYKYMPVRRPATRVALAGGACAAVLWHLASPIFTTLMALAPQRNAFYGGLAGVVLYSLWAMLGAQVLLVGAHFAATLDHIVFLRRGPEEDDRLIGIEQRNAELQWRLGILEFHRKPTAPPPSDDEAPPPT